MRVRCDLHAFHSITISYVCHLINKILAGLRISSKGRSKGPFIYPGSFEGAAGGGGGGLTSFEVVNFYGLRTSFQNKPLVVKNSN